MSADSDIIHLNASNDVHFRDARDSRDDTPITTGTGTFSVTDMDGTEVASGSLAHTSGGDWVGAFDAMDDDFVEGQRYRIDVSVVSSSRKGFRRLIRQAKYAANG